MEPLRPARGVHATHDRDAARLVAELERVRQRGYAEARDEREEDLAAVAAPVFDSRGELAGILGVQGPSSRFDARADAAAVPLLAGARRERSPLRSAAASALGLRRGARQGRRRGRGSASRASRRSRLHPVAVGADDEEARRRSATSSSRASIGRGLQSRNLSTSTRAGARALPARAARPRPPRCRRTRTPSRARSGRAATSAALTMISGCPDSTAASTASSVASGSKGTSKVTSITGRLPATPGMSALVRLRRTPSTATPAAAANSASGSACGRGPATEWRDHEQCEAELEQEEEEGEADIDKDPRAGSELPPAQGGAPAPSGGTGARAGAARRIPGAGSGLCSTSCRTSGRSTAHHRQRPPSRSRR